MTRLSPVELEAHFTTIANSTKGYPQAKAAIEGALLDAYVEADVAFHLRERLTGASIEYVTLQLQMEQYIEEHKQRKAKEDAEKLPVVRTV